MDIIASIRFTERAKNEIQKKQFSTEQKSFILGMSYGKLLIENGNKSMDQERQTEGWMVSVFNGMDEKTAEKLPHIIVDGMDILLLTPQLKGKLENATVDFSGGLFFSVTR